MPRPRPTKEQLRAQIAAAQSQFYDTDSIEYKIAASLLNVGRFDDTLDSKELALILRNLVYTMFAEQRIGGLDVGLVHNVPVMKVAINNNEAKVNFIVHIHKPIIAFLEFDYILVNDPVSVAKRIRLKRGSLSIREHTRRFDLKAKAALAATNVSGIASKELSNVGQVILSTLPHQLEMQGIVGNLTCVELNLEDHQLRVCLEGEFDTLEKGIL